jgi:nifR3 family TIM-barrel protein
MGCPVRKVVKTGAGAALLRAPERAAKIMQTLERAPAIPYTIKVRTGWDHDTFVLDDFIKIAAEFNAKALTCHPRTAKMRFSGNADWDHLFSAAAKTSLPVIGSGDINDTETAKNHLAHPALSGIMLGRGTYGRPWFFREIKELLDNGKSWLPDSNLKRKTIFTHGELLREEYGEKHSLLIYRKHLAWYIKGIPGAAAFRKKIFTLTDHAAIEDTVNELFQQPVINHL